MQDPLSLHLTQPHHFPFPPHPSRTLRLPPAAVSSKTSATAAAAATTISFPPKPTKATVVPSPPPPPPPPPPPLPSHAEFEEKMLFLDSLGIDFFALIRRHPDVAAAPLPDLKSTLHFLSSMGFTAVELRRVVGMCPEVLTSRVADVLPVFTFLLREARVDGSDLRRVVNRRPRLLACSVKHRLRPTLYFLQSIGIAEVNKYTSLLSCSVEDKFVPRIEYFKNLGFSHRDATVMFRRFPQLFCYSIKENLEPKFNYFVVEMGRDFKELKEFPHYFSFSLENRIKPRHKCCVEKGVCFPLPTLLKTSEEQFQKRLDICCNSSMPLSSSPLWCTNCEV
ncbi:transcription termination factor MTEF1, chloroplastic [Syzygium oleosum]|uniref:transcription termination factor MTEF1, chloroplastic n=1 Tax=Syzygium oleosum TaxID=219896 RepID=UPI0024BB5E84|nr:transcription termination factor MTEF1, chloroplastic [Syzygium oleosum]